ARASGAGASAHTDNESCTPLATDAPQGRTSSGWKCRLAARRRRHDVLDAHNPESQSSRSLDDRVRLARSVLLLTSEPSALAGSNPTKRQSATSWHEQVAVEAPSSTPQGVALVLSPHRLDADLYPGWLDS